MNGEMKKAKTENINNKVSFFLSITLDKQTFEWALQTNEIGCHNKVEILFTAASPYLFIWVELYRESFWPWKVKGEWKTFYFHLKEYQSKNYGGGYCGGNNLKKSDKVFNYERSSIFWRYRLDSIECKNVKFYKSRFSC